MTLFTALYYIVPYTDLHLMMYLISKLNGWQFKQVNRRFKTGFLR